MDSLLLMSLRIALIVVIWLLILAALRACFSDTTRVLAATGEITTRGGAHAVARAAATGGAHAGFVAAPSVAPDLIESDLPVWPSECAISSGPLAGTRIALHGLHEVIVGRHPDCTFVLHDDFVSSHHARFFRTEEGWYIEDLGSRNGTFLGDTRVTAPLPLGIDDDVRIGQTYLRLTNPTTNPR